jgi:branched-chain amino acid transport system ATP-binding protein
LGNQMIEVRGIDVRYGRIQALWDVSLSISEGELVALLGANGSGKSTTLKTLSGLLRPNRGEIFFGGKAIQGMPPERVVGLGLVQVPERRRVFPLMSVEENLLMGGFHKSARKGRKAAIAEVFETFPILRERRRQLAGTLSGGEQQMLAIGRALVARPKLLMLDEPSLGLAPSLVREIFAAVRRINSSGTTVLLVEQNIHEALKLAQRGYVLENGRVIMQDSSSNLLASEHVRRAYLGL